MKICFDKYVIKNEECWDWSGNITEQGYAALRFRGKQLKGHRLNWILNNGQIPDGLWILHSCDNRKCTKPQHLFLGNCFDNISDMVKKKRNRSYSKLNENQILRIRELLDMGVTLKRIAQDHKVSDKLYLI